MYGADRIRHYAHEDEYLFAAAIDVTRKYVYTMGCEKCCAGIAGSPRVNHIARRRASRPSRGPLYRSDAIQPADASPKPSGMFVYRYVLSPSMSNIGTLLSKVEPLSSWPPGLCSISAAYLGYAGVDRPQKIYLSSLLTASRRSAVWTCCGNMCVEPKSGDIYADFNGIPYGYILHIRMNSTDISETRILAVVKTETEAKAGESDKANIMYLTPLIQDRFGQLYIAAIFQNRHIYSLQLPANGERTVRATVAYVLPKCDFDYHDIVFSRDTNQLCVFVFRESTGTETVTSPYGLVRFYDSSRFEFLAFPHIPCISALHIGDGHLISCDRERAIVWSKTTDQLFGKLECLRLAPTDSLAQAIPSCVADNVDGRSLYRFAVADESWVFWIDQSKMLCSAFLPPRT